MTRSTTEVDVRVSQHSELVIRGCDSRHILERLAGWVREHHRDVLIVGMQWTNEWGLDDDGVIDGNAPLHHVATMQFRTGAQRDLGWDAS